MGQLADVENLQGAAPDRDLDPRSTALLLIGFQGEYFGEDGLLRSYIEEPEAIARALISTLALLRSLSGTDVLIVSTPICFTSDYAELVDPVGILAAIKEAGAFQAGGPGARTASELEQFAGRIIEIPGKRGLDAFSNTALDDLLEDHGIVDVVLAGALTTVCIDSTGRSAYERGYRVSVLSDCTLARSHFEQDYFFANIIPLYASPLDSHQLIERLIRGRTVRASA